MKIETLNLNTEHFIVEHLHGSLENQRLVNEGVRELGVRE